MDIIKWFNRQKPITLGFITAITCGIIMTIFSYFTDKVFNLNYVLKLSGSMSLLMFFISLILFSMGESSEKVFDEINSLYFRAKNIVCGNAFVFYLAERLKQQK